MAQGWQFSLIDFTQDPLNPITTPIPEPVGWDGMTLHLKRDETLHGFFSFEDDSFSSLQYDNAGADVLRNAYYNFGIEAVVQLGITYNCDGEENDNLYLGQFDFTTFVEYTADRCYVECATIVSESLMLYRKRADQQVDLDSLASADQLPVTQYITAAVEFQSGTNLLRLPQLLNGLLAGSQITISGAANFANNGSFYVASAKPDYQNVNPDISGGSTPLSADFSVTFNPTNGTLSVNQELSIAIGDTIQVIGTGNITVSNGPSFTCNDGNYRVIALQQFFGYTVFTILLISIPNTAPLPLNYGTGGTPATGAYYIEQSLDTVVLNASWVSTRLPTATIVQVPLQPVLLIDENVPGAVITGSVSVNTLTVTHVFSGTILIGQGIGHDGHYIVSQSSGATGGIGAYIVSGDPFVLASCRITTGVLFTGQWLINNMAPYTALGKIIAIPPKEIIAKSVYKTLFDLVFILLKNGAVGGVGVAYHTTLAITPDIPNILSDIGETDVGTGVPVYVNVGRSGSPFNNPNTTPANTQPDNFIFFRQGSLACSGLGTLKYNINYEAVTAVSDPGPTSKYAASRLHLVFKAGSDPTTIQDTGTTVVVSVPFTAPIGTKGNLSGTVENIVFPPGYFLWMYINAEIENIQDGWCFNLLIGANSEVDFTINSLCVETPCSTYFLAESMSRCAESYTNGNMRVYSDYFGRQNAQPVASPEDGCGGLEVITNGVRVRGCSMPDGSAIPKFYTSLSDMFTALDAIHNIGVGLEVDPNRAGFNRLRVEPFEWFFQQNVMFICDKIMSFQRSVQQNLLPTTFGVGYQQFETWNNNGLYDIFGNRTYRTPLNQLQNNLDKTCKWMASDYAIEFTRRQFGLSTSDSRYDANTFILCLTGKFQSNIEIVTQCILILNLEVSGGRFFRNDPLVTYTISQAVNGANNISGLNVVNVIASAAPNTFNNMMYVYFTGSALVNEYNAAITVTRNIGGELVDVPCFFMGATNTIVLDQQDLFDTAPQDVLVVTGGGIGTNDFTVTEIFSPQIATPDGDTIPIDFPMVVFTADTPLPDPYYESNANIENANHPFYTVEQIMKNGTNILSPETVMNYRISPAHNAMRHFRNVISDRYFAEQTLTFTGGQGNFYALGEINDSCTSETGMISEGGNLSLVNFRHHIDAEPLFFAEIVKFEYPLSWANFLIIENNPYGLIQYRHANEQFSQGWLVDLQYNPYKGMATFSLYPKAGKLDIIEPEGT